MSAPDIVPPFGSHGRRILPRVEILSYNIEIHEGRRFLGDRANKAAFFKHLDAARRISAHLDPFGTRKSAELNRKEIDALLLSRNAAAAAIVMGAVENFSQDFARVIRRFRRQKSWTHVRRIAVGGGMRGRLVGELVIERTTQILNEEGAGIDLTPVAHDPDDAGLIGSLYLLPEWVFKGYRAIVAADIGGSNIRTGLVRFHFTPGRGFSRIRVAARQKWKHGEENISRDAAIEKLTRQLKRAIAAARRAHIPLAPVIGIACPGLIGADGAILRGGQNLPGNWSARSFRLADAIGEDLPRLGGQPFQVILHNDAVIQGLSEIPRMRGEGDWGVLTLGTGLGNACFRNV